MQLRCRTHAVWAWPLLTLSSSFHQGCISSRYITFNQPGGCQHKSRALAWGGWHFKYVNAKAIKTLAYLLRRLLTTRVTYQWYFSALIGVWVSVDTVLVVRLCGRYERTEWAANCTIWCSVKSGSMSERAEGGRESRVRRSGRERKGDRWEGESGSWSDPTDQMLINWVHCQLSLSSVTVTPLHFTLFFSCSSSSYFPSASSVPHLSVLFLFRTTYIYLPLSFCLFTCFHKASIILPKSSGFLLFFKIPALH